MDRDWTEQLVQDNTTVTWGKWAEESANANENGAEDLRAQAITTLYGLADYLDVQYAGGYRGISPMPLARCYMGWD